MLVNRTKKGLILVLAFILMTSSAVFAAPVHKDTLTVISAENISKHIQKLTKNDQDNSRVAGFKGECKAADYIAKEFESYGMKVERQKFDINAFLCNEAQVIVNGENFETNAFMHSPSTDKDGITAELVYCGLGDTGDFEDKDVEGKIALISRGGIPFVWKTENARNNGAIGVIFYNIIPGEINGMLYDDGRETIPAVELSQADGLKLVAAIEAAESAGKVVNATLITDTTNVKSYSQNIIATLDNKAAKTIVIGAHYDGPDTPAANDNASGTAAMLEIARVLSREKLDCNIKFIGFGAEVLGAVGSYKYVGSLSDDEINDTIAMINMDTIGAGDTVGVMTIDEDADQPVADLAETYLKKSGLKYAVSTSYSSDHAAFAEAGIPSVYLNYGAEAYSYTDEDISDNINKQNLYNIASLVKAMTYDLANTPMPEAAGVKGKPNKHMRLRVLGE